MSVQPLPSILPPFPSTSYYAIAGRTICVQACDEASARIIAKFIDGYYFAPVTPDERRTGIYQTIRISTGAPLPNMVRGTKLYDEDDGQCHTDGESYYLYLNDSLIIVSGQASKLVELWIGVTPQARTPLNLGNVLANGVQIALRRCGIYKLHAAGVVKPESHEGVLIIGDSGCGKSTLTIELAASGWRYLSDDAVILSEGSSLVEAHGHRRRFALTEASFNVKRSLLLAKAVGPPFAANANKRWVDPTMLFPNLFAESCIPRALVFPSITDNLRTTVTKLPQSEAMKLLIQQCPLIFFDLPIARQHVKLLMQLVKQSMNYKLVAGRDLLAERGTTSDLFASHIYVN